MCGAGVEGWGCKIGKWGSGSVGWLWWWSCDQWGPCGLLVEWYLWSGAALWASGSCLVCPVLWSSGPVLQWFMCPVLSCGPVVPVVPVVQWPSSPWVQWSSGPVVLWSCGPVLLANAFGHHRGGPVHVHSSQFSQFVLGHGSIYVREAKLRSEK